MTQKMVYIYIGNRLFAHKGKLDKWLLYQILYEC